MSANPPKLSFGFVKIKAVPKLLDKPAISSSIKSSTPQVDFLSSFEGKTAKSIHVDNETDLVIPITHSRIGIRAEMRKKYAKVDPMDQLTAEAVKELTSGTLMEVDESAENSKLVVPMKIKNEKMENQEKEAEENIDDADYNLIPIECFGMALLKGMGFTEKQKGPSFDDCTTLIINLISEPRDYLSKVRLKGLGLGADPEVLKKARQAAKQPIVNGNEKLSWKVGARCQVLIGRQEGQYGVVQGFDGDTGRVVIRFSASKEVRKIMQSILRLVPEAEFNKFANYINKSSADKYKAEEVNGDQDVSNTAKNENGLKSVSEELHPLAHPSRSDRSRSPLSSSSSPAWARKGLIVRYMNKSGPDKQFYKERMKIVDSNSSGSRFTCETENRERLKNVRIRDLQTIVPKHRGDAVQVVRGRYDGQLASVVKRDSETSMVRVELQDWGGKVVDVSFDEVCSIK